MAKSAMMLARAKTWWSFLASRNCSLFTPCRRLPHFSIRNWKLPCFIIDNYISKPQVNLTEKLGRNNKKLIFHRHVPCFELVILRHAQSLILPKHIRLLTLVMFNKNPGFSTIQSVGDGDIPQFWMTHLLLYLDVHSTNHKRFNPYITPISTQDIPQDISHLTGGRYHINIDSTQSTSNVYIYIYTYM